MKYYEEYLNEAISAERAKELYAMGRKVAGEMGTHKASSSILTPETLAKIKASIPQKALERRALLAKWHAASNGHDVELTNRLHDQILSLEKQIHGAIQAVSKHDREVHLNTLVQRSKQKAARQ